MNIPLYIVIVIYNQHIDEIVSLNNFLLMKEECNVKIIIFDNSNNVFSSKNKELLKIEKYKEVLYVDNCGNIGLSKSYNRALDLIAESKYWVMLADDDTDFSIQYIKNAYEEMKKDRYRLITGIIHSNNRVFSPVSKYSVFHSKMKFITKAGVYSNIYAVNSGLIIHSSVFEKVGKFDERLFLDMVDYHFMEQLIKAESNQICVVQGNIVQKFSGETAGGWKSDLVRFRLLKHDLKMFYNINQKNKITMCITLGKRMLSIIIKNVNYAINKT